MPLNNFLSHKTSPQERKLEAQVESTEIRAKRLMKVLNEERSLRERERISGEQEQAVKDEEASRCGHPRRTCRLTFPATRMPSLPKDVEG